MIWKAITTTKHTNKYCFVVLRIVIAYAGHFVTAVVLKRGLVQSHYQTQSDYSSVHDRSVLFKFPAPYWDHTSILPNMSLAYVNYVMSFTTHAGREYTQLAGRVYYRINV